jgi:aryl-alcohol dehydrogenase-like predicted oxidoreductase
MEYVNLGKTGLKVSRICLGCMSYAVTPAKEAGPGTHLWALNEADSAPYFKQALDHGINFFDTANVYSVGQSEEVLGRYLKANVARDSVVIATKVRFNMRQEANGGGLSRKAILSEIDHSLRRLQTDYATSARPACTPGSLRRRSISPTGTAGRASSPCRTTTTCSTAKKSAR